ncbi:MAG TPA: adenylate/guanylate cyclase domain-containing protein [Candidatus Limnocylindria bacterium]|nr:adenylate/guanylate cyclase domain-containing protein [Candidatus Limnocylindria bacterium]
MAQTRDLPDTSLVEVGRAALERHEWRAAFDALKQADEQEQLPPQALELLAQAAWWTGQLPLAIDAHERGYAAAMKVGDIPSAVLAAVELGRENIMRISLPVANAWLNKAEKLLEGAPENIGHGWLAAVRSYYASLMGDSQAALDAATTANAIGKRLGDRNLEIFALAEMGQTLVNVGRVEEGLAAADEATVSALSGELQPAVAGGVFCSSIEACAGLGDYRRAAEWTDAQDRWCQREGINGFPGMCRVFRSDVKRLRGAWPEAEAEARLATDELRGFVPGAAGWALYQVAQIRLRRGDLPAAEEALQGVHGFGLNTEPAYSLLQLALGKPEEAAKSITEALSAPGGRPSFMAARDSVSYRLTLLSAQVEIFLATGDIAGARAAADELGKIGETFGTLASRAAAAAASGAVALAEGDAAAAGVQLRLSIEHWTEVDAPWEVGRARMLLASALLALGDPDHAAREARSARSTFEQLGALPDLRQADALMAALQSEAPDATPFGTAATRVVRAFMFTDIVDSTRLAEVMGDEAWDRVTRTHDQLLRSAVAEQGGEEVKATGDGFFFAFAGADQAIEAAVAIQRRLAAHRDAQGFVPAVRIGIHQSEANRVGLDYAGSGVNQAARIGDAAEGGEILASATTLEAAKHSFAQAGRRSLSLKGVAAQVDVASVAWR